VAVEETFEAVVEPAVAADDDAAAVVALLAVAPVAAVVVVPAAVAAAVVVVPAVAAVVVPDEAPVVVPLLADVVPPDEVLPAAVVPELLTVVLVWLQYGPTKLPVHWHPQSQTPFPEQVGSGHPACVFKHWHAVPPYADEHVQVDGAPRIHGPWPLHCPWVLTGHGVL